MIKFFDPKHIFIKILLFIILICSIWNITLNFENDKLISKLIRKIGVFEFGYNKDILEMVKIIKVIGTLTVENDKSQLEIINKILINISKIEEIQQKTENILLTTKKIDIDNIENIKQANLLIINKTTGCSGSGTHIKINNKSYVLTVAHLLDGEGDELIAMTDIRDVYILHYVKLNKKFDMALFKINNVENLPHLEISNENPKEGSEVILIGNPDFYDDIISDGIIAKIGKTRYLVTNITYYGGSGGALLYKGKIIGMTSQIFTAYEPPVFVNYTSCPNIIVLRKFLMGIK